jgi:hypothetical protein
MIVTRCNKEFTLEFYLLVKQLSFDNMVSFVDHDWHLFASALILSPILIMIRSDECDNMQ